MIKTIKALIQAVNFMHLPKSKRKIVFYSEGGNYWPIFNNIIVKLTEDKGIRVCYLTSDMNDSGCQYFHKNYTSFVIDQGYVRNWLFLNMDSKIVLMTMPDLDQYQLKKSRHKVHYIYIQHALMSLHMAYRSGAFDSYDTIFCAGQHHVEEVTKTEEVYNLKKKNIVKIGYERIDKLINSKKVFRVNVEHILIAPSWGKESLIEGENGVEKLIDKLLKYGYFVTFRPHPETIKSSSKIVNKLVNKFSCHKMFNYESGIESIESFFSSDVMITDWSGSALEYGLGLAKPVIFLDLAKKINNPKYTDINITPFEVEMREKIGIISTVSDIDKGMIESLNLKNKSKNLNPRDYIFNIGNSCNHAVEYIENLLGGID